MLLPTDPSIYLTPLALLSLVAAFFQIRESGKELSRKKKELDQKIYETLILREIGQRIGYELNIGKILDTIVDSLNKFLPYSVSSYILVSDDGTKLNQRVQVEESVNKAFLEVTTKYMLDCLNNFVGLRNFTEGDVSQMTTGTIVSEESTSDPKSIWVTQVFINKRGVGVLAIASKNPGLYKGPEMEFLVKILAQANQALNNLETIISSERGKLESMVSSMADGVLMFDQNYNLILVNPAAVALLGLATGAKPTIFDVAKVLADKLDIRTKLEESIKEDRLVSFDNLSVGGKISQLLMSPVKDNKKRLLGAVVLFHDKTAEKQLQTLREDFTAMMVHELRAPLSVVAGTADMFVKDPALSETTQGKELLKTTKESVNSVLSLINDLLDVAKMESGKFQIIKSSGNLSEVVTERAEFFRQMATTKNLTLECRVEENLNLAFDRDRMAQVLNNLISNAIKFTLPGGKIAVRAYRITSNEEIGWQFQDSKLHKNVVPVTGASAIVSVSDSGIGIDEAKMSELFSKFKQLHKVEPGPGGVFGTGLGLIIAKGIVESHGGKIFVESQINQGSTFYLILPLDN